jgi:hypothetical protein
VHKHILLNREVDHAAVLEPRRFRRNSDMRYIFVNCRQMHEIEEWYTPESTNAPGHIAQGL